MPWLNWACWVWDCSRAVAECKASERVFADQKGGGCWDRWVLPTFFPWAYSGTIS
jgi:hypothetical protein